MVLNNNILTTVNTSIKADISAEFTHVDFGTGTTTPTSADTVMETSVVRNARQDITTLSNDVIVSGFLGSGQGNASTITEIGVFDAGASGNMQSHALITGIAKTSAKEIWVDVRTNITLSQT